ncbi:hypothetical protein KXD40_009356 [Peronospora effusa]|uniref:Uncharacterized protein n=1 Tax=Peronospora effusa TaxID=542832 RepID=A0A3M6VMW4_9STRA|nr:hypothetical protein DD238_007663 [Peronospora effusa]RQM18798.1 hypothetical protein DD237_008001 [Peronospora effusa]UIZ28491.1 hypothetical protein KXD40_009356 [Peronospora effusa]
MQTGRLFFTSSHRATYKFCLPIELSVHVKEVADGQVFDLGIKTVWYPLRDHLTKRRQGLVAIYCHSVKNEASNETSTGMLTGSYWTEPIPSVKYRLEIVPPSGVNMLQTKSILQRDK